MALVLDIMASSAGAQDTQRPREAEQHRHENGVEPAHDGTDIQLALTYTSDINALSRTPSATARYLHRIGLIADVDLDHAIGWRGAAAHMSIHSIQGRGLSEDVLNNILPVSGLEARPAVRLFNLWLEQRLAFGSVRVGQFTAGQEFAISTNAALFVNATFGWPASFAADLPSGGPAYPLAAPGVRLSTQSYKGTSARLAIFAGDPAGKGQGDPQRRDLHGLNSFRLSGRPFVIAELQQSSAVADPSWVVRAGGWVHLGHRDDRSQVSELGLQRAANYALYGIVDTRLWRSGASKRELQAFVRISASPADRNLVDLYADAGLTLTAPVATRKQDAVGIAVGFAHVTTPSRLRDDAPRRPSASSYAGVLEISYRLALTPTVSLQPSVQRLFHPDAGVDVPAGPDRQKDDVTVLGLRTTARF